MLKEIKWWTRWWIRYFPVCAYRRMFVCPRLGHDLYDGMVCMTCGAPWFKDPHQ